MRDLSITFFTEPKYVEPSLYTAFKLLIVFVYSVICSITLFITELALLPILYSSIS